MRRREWTLLVIAEDDTRVRQFHLSRDAVRATIAATLIGLSLLFSLAAGFLFSERKQLQAELLRRENQQLAAELEQIRAHVAEFNRSLQELSERDTQFRLLAGLDPLSEDVHQAGIGGPGGERLEDHPLAELDANAGRLAFATATDVSTLVRRARLLSASWKQATDALAAEHARLAATPSIAPTDGFISSAFSRRRWHPILDRPRPHEGVDITAPHGTAIYAVADGRVAFSGRNGDYGLMVELDHGFGYVTRYAHASRLLVRRGESVQRGDKIAEVGKTGLAIGPHLHYEVLIEGRPANPRNFILDGWAIPD